LGVLMDRNGSFGLGRLAIEPICRPLCMEIQSV
jgi:hypothetical protein